jgi:hypothetical protein
MASGTSVRTDPPPTAVLDAPAIERPRHRRRNAGAMSRTSCLAPISVKPPQIRQGPEPSRRHDILSNSNRLRLGKSGVRRVRDRYG